MQNGNALHRCVMALPAALLALLLGGCQATLFHLVNATSEDNGLVERRNIVFDSSNRLALDIYAPRNAHDLPVVVFFYGGSWQDGKRQWYRWMGETLARHGLVVAIPDYRKYPQVKMDGFVTDAADAVAWVHAHAADYGGNPDAMFLMGHSAGAHIGALLATDARWLEKAGMQPRQLAGFIGLAGPYDFLPLKDPAFIGMFGAAPKAQARSQPVNFVDGDEPPMLLLQGTADHVVAPRNACSLADLLQSQGEPVEVHLYLGIGHARLLLSFSRPLRGSSPALRDTLRFIHEYANTDQASSNIPASRSEAHATPETAGCNP